MIGKIILISYLIVGATIIWLISESRKSLEDEPILIKLKMRLSHALIVVASTVFWPLVVILFSREPKNPLLDISSKDLRKYFSTPETRIRIITIEEAEDKEYISDPLGAVSNQPFGHLYPAWIKFKAEIYPQDELWEFKASKQLLEDFKKNRYAYLLNGINWMDYQDGYVIIRNGEVVGDIFTNAG